MASKKLGSPSVSSDLQTNVLQLQENLKKVQAEYDAERTKVKQLRREKTLEVQKVREQAINNSRIALKDLKSKLNAEKQRELEVQRNTLSRRYEAELIKLRKQKDGEVTKLRNNLRKCQNELTEAIQCLANSAQHRGLSGAARANVTFESERAKLLADVQELTNSKHQLENNIKSLTDSERHKTHTIKMLEENMKSQVDKVKREADMEAKRLLDELKKKDRTIEQMEKDISVKLGQITKLQHEAEANMDLTRRNNELMRRFATRGLSKKADSLSSLESSSSDSADISIHHTENETQIQQLQEQVQLLKDENFQLMNKVQDTKDLQRPLHEKTRRFLEKNMELTALNRSLEDKMKILLESNTKLKVESEKCKSEKNALSDRITRLNVDSEVINAMEKEIERMRVEMSDQEDVILALQHACTDKDRRLELLSHRKRKQKNTRSQQKMVRFLLPARVHIVAAGIKETYYGYDEDRASVDSENSSRLSLDATLDDDDIFDDVTKEECEKNYQRLAREHLELERSFALLQNQSAISTGPYGPELLEVGWTDDEKTETEKKLKRLAEKLAEADHNVTKTQRQLHETQEQNEVLEFRLLELQEVHNKLLEEAEEAKSELSFHLEESEESPQLEPGALEAKNTELRKKIHSLRRNSSQDGSSEERSLLLQAKILLDVSDKKLKELLSNEENFKSRINKLEEERAGLLLNSKGEPDDLVLDYEKVRNELSTAKLDIDKLEESNKILKVQNEDLIDQVKQFGKIRDMDAQVKKADDTDKPVSELLQEEIISLKHGEIQLAEQNTRLSQELRRVQDELDSTRDELIAVSLENTGITKLKTENKQLSGELTLVKNELKSAQENLSSATVEHSMLSHAKVFQDDDLIHDNQRLRAEIFSLQEQLKSYESKAASLNRWSSSEELLTSPEHKINVLEKEIWDLKHHNDLLKSKLKDREKDVLRSREVVVSIESDLVDFETENTELREKLEDLETEDENEVAALRVKVRALERSARMLQEQLENAGGEVSIEVEDIVEELETEKDKVAELRKHMDKMAEDLVQLDSFKAQVSELELSRKELKDKVKHLQEVADRESERAVNLEFTVAKLKAKNKSGKSDDSDDSSTEEQSDLTTTVHMLKAENTELHTKVSNLEQQLVESKRNISHIKEGIAETLEEKNSRIDVLETELSKLQANGDTLNESIEELREVENALRKQVSDLEGQSSSDSDREDEKLMSLSLEMTQLQDANSGLLSEIAEMTETERSLRSQLSDLDSSYKTQLAELQMRITAQEAAESSSEGHSSSGEMDDPRESKKKLTKTAGLEAKIQKLLARESELLEQVYSMKLENQELQEHVELLQGGSDSEGISPRSKDAESKEEIIDELQLKVKVLEEDNSKLKDDLFKIKLESIDRVNENGATENALEFKVLQEKINMLEQERNNLMASAADNDDQVISLKEKIEELEKEVNRVPLLLSQLDTIRKDNELLVEKSERLRDQIEQLESQKDVEEEKILLKVDTIAPLGSSKDNRHSKSSESEEDSNHLEELKSRLHQLEEEVQQMPMLKSQLTAMKNHNDLLAESAIELKEYLEDLEAQNIGLKQDNGELNNRLEDINAELIEVEKQIPELKSQLDSVKERNSLLIENSTKMKLHIDELEAQERELHEQLRRKKVLQVQLQEIETKMTDLEIQNNEMKYERDLIETERNELKDDKNELVRRLTCLEEEKDNLEKEKDELQSELKVIKIEKENISLILKGNAIEIEKLQSENKDIKCEQEEFENQMKELNEIVPLSDELRLQNERLQGDYDELKLKMNETIIEKADLEKSEKELRVKCDGLVEKLNQSEEKCNGVEKLLNEKKETEVKLFEKIEILVDSEGRLMERLEELEDEEDNMIEEIEKLKEENDKLKRQAMDVDEADKETRQKVDELEKKERDLKDHIIILETRKEELQGRLDEVNTVEREELIKLREKVDILLDSEEKLMDKLQDQAEIEGKLKEQIAKLEDGDKELRVQLVKEKEEARSRSSSKSSNDMDNEMRKNVEQINELEQNNRLLKLNIVELEKSEAVLKAQIEGLEKTIKSLAQSDSDLRERLQEVHQEKIVLNGRCEEQEKMQILLATKVEDLEDQNRELLDALKGQQKAPETHYHITSSSPEHEGSDFVTSIEEQVIQAERGATLAAAPPSGRTPDDMLKQPERKSPIFGLMSSQRKPEVATLYAMSKDELISRLYESEQMEQFHHDKIRELSEHLSQFRQAVEVVAVTMETDADVPTPSFKSSTKDLEFEAKVQAIVKSEILLKMKVLELEKRESILRDRLREAEELLKEHNADRKQEVEELDEEMDSLRRSEARLKNQLQYGQQLPGDPASLAKIHHLETLVFDLESSERKLQRKIEDLEDNARALRKKVSIAESVQCSHDANHDKYNELLTEVRHLESTNRNLQDQISDIEKSDTKNLVSKIAELERSEQELKRKIEFLEENRGDHNRSFTMLDSPEAILKQRILELEKMEQHFKQQIIELESDREELHEIARKDKNYIHEIAVQLRELQLSEKNLKDQLNNREASESQLQLQVDDLCDKIEELQEQIRKLKVQERQLKQALMKTENKEVELTAELENALGDVEFNENKWKKKVSELQEEKVILADRLEEVTLHVSDLEHTEITLKQKLKDKDEAEHDRTETLVKLEESESFALSRVHELEAVNEALSQKLRKLEEEKASLLYEISDLESTHIDGSALKKSQRKLLEELASKEGAGTNLQKKLQKMMERENELEDEVERYVKLEKEWNIQRDEMETTEKSLRDKICKLEALITANEMKVSFVTDLENENSILHRNLSHQQKTIQKNDEEIHKLQDRINQYEYSSANNALATIPTVELAELRSRSKLLVETEANVVRLENLVAHLRECIEKLRNGQDAHGYELEIAEMKEKVNKYNQAIKDQAGLQWALTSTKKAHELLKENHDYTKKELKALQAQIQKGEVSVSTGSPPDSSSKAVLTRLTHSFTLSEITPGELVKELKQALKQLGSKHPEAYEEFVRTLHPSAGGMAVVRPTQDLSTRMKIDGPISEEHIEPVHAVHTKSVPRITKTYDGSGTKHQVYGRLTDGEETVWSTIEGQASAKGGMSDEEPFWINIENATDDVTLTMVLDDETHDSDVIKKSRAYSSSSAHSTSSVGSSAPPLPDTTPPELSMRRLDSPGNDSSYYLPSAQESMISADEASDIDEDDITGLRSRSRTPPRAKSLDRDSVISESLLGSSPGRKMTSSLDSIPDSGMGTMAQTERDMLREKISLLEKQLKSKEKELNLAQINQRELDVDSTSQTLVELQDKVQRLQEDLKSKDAEIDAMATASKSKGEDKSELESNATLLKLQLERKEKELTAKNNSIDRLTQELRKWQEDFQVAQNDKDSTQKILKETQDQLDSDQIINETFIQLQNNHEQLLKEHKELENKYSQTLNGKEEKEALEKIVLKLKGQLTDLERIDLERQQLENKLKAVEEELKATKLVENQLAKENATLQREVELLTRNNNTLHAVEGDFHKVKSKYVEMEKSKSQAQNLVTPLRAKVIRLSKVCKEKDNLIERLAQEVHQTDTNASVITEADKMLAKSASEEYNRPLTPLNVPNEEVNSILDDLPPLVSASSVHTGVEPNGDINGPRQMEARTTRDDIEDLIEQRTINGTQYSAPPLSSSKQNTAVASTNPVTIDDLIIAPQASLAPVTQLKDGHDAAHTLPKLKKHLSVEGTGVRRTRSTDKYRAVKDYNPEHFSRSGHQRLELPLKEGDIVTVLGSTDDKGYFEAEKDGRIGLVPANYLQPVYPTRPHRPKSEISGERAPEQILSMHADLQRIHVPDHRVPYVSSTYDDNISEGSRSGSSSARSSRGGSSITHPMFLGAPVMPMARKPKRTIKPQQPVVHGYISQPGPNQTNGQPPEISNSMPSLPTSSAQAKPTSATNNYVTGEVNLPANKKLCGPPAPPSNLRVQRVVGRHSLLLAWNQPIMDDLAASNGSTVQGYCLHIDGHDKQDIPSPHLTKALIEHLNLRKAHHFIIETVSTNGLKSRPVQASYEGPIGSYEVADGDSAGDGDVSSILSGSYHGDQDRRVFMAVYDYDPQKQSPKSDVSNELPLNAGDIITIIGSGRSDGFFNAKVKGRKGLVPANFIEEIALFRSASHRSLMSAGSAMTAPSSRHSSGGIKARTNHAYKIPGAAQI